MSEATIKYNVVPSKNSISFPAPVCKTFSYDTLGSFDPDLHTHLHFCLHMLVFLPHIPSAFFVQINFVVVNPKVMISCMLEIFSITGLQIMHLKIST